jgi:hypothetical protein
MSSMMPRADYLLALARGEIPSAFNDERRLPDARYVRDDARLSEGRKGALRPNDINDLILPKPPLPTNTGKDSLPREIVEGLERLRCTQPPKGYHPDRWVASVKCAVRLASDWASIALQVGWSIEELFGLDPDAPDTRLDVKGLAFSLTDNQSVVAITSQAATIRCTKTGAILRFYRTIGATRSIPAWELDRAGR